MESVTTSVALCYAGLRSSADSVLQLSVFSPAPPGATRCGYVTTVAPVDPQPVEGEGLNEAYWCTLATPLTAAQNAQKQSTGLKLEKKVGAKGQKSENKVEDTNKSTEKNDTAFTHHPLTFLSRTLTKSNFLRQQRWLLSMKTEVENDT
ncbi:hypothetical protein Q8A73_002550 [Channa argus]|nr:hypothetical protein Q8A73_002550 [Channa argus]